MDLNLLEKHSEFEWQISPKNGMRVPAIIYGSENLIRDMDQKVVEQITNVATLPGIVQAAYAMPDAHWGYGFPIGGVAAFDQNEDGVISAGGVGFDISCGVRLLLTGIKRSIIETQKEQLAEVLFKSIPAGVGSKSSIKLSDTEMDKMLNGGAKWAVKQGYGNQEDLEHTEEKGCMSGAVPSEVSERAKERQRREMGTLGSGNHYLELQEVVEIFDKSVAGVFGLSENDIVISIHCGSRGLGHQIGTEFLKLMAIEASRHGIMLPDRELACAPIKSQIGQSYIGAMRAAMNCAMANRQILTSFVRNVFYHMIPDATIKVLYDVSHNTCKEEEHRIGRASKKLFVHRKGATRAFGPGHEGLPEIFKKTGQPVIIGGSMGTGSFILVGTNDAEKRSFSSSCHGAGRAMSRTKALHQWKGREVVESLAKRGIIVRSGSFRGVAEEAPEAYKSIESVAESAHQAGLSKKVARLVPVICIKG